MSCLPSKTISLFVPNDIEASIEISTKDQQIKLFGLCCNKISIKLVDTFEYYITLKTVSVTFKNMLVVGGGYIGLEMASVWSRLGSEVTVIETLDKIVSTMDKEISEYFLKHLYSPFQR